MNRPDFTRLAVSRQLDAMNCDRYEIGVFDRAQDKMALREWDRAAILRSLGWLKSQNVNGKDIYIRPFGSAGLCFFDDLNRGGLARLKDEGLQPALVIESSPSNFHGWIRVSAESMDDSLATACCKVIARRFAGDVDSADWRHFGRLAGFTNQKPAYRDELGRAPFVKIEQTEKALAPAGQQLIDEGGAYLLHREEEKKQRAARLKSRVPPQSLSNASQFFQSELAGLIKRYGTSLDRSKADWMISEKMADRGYTPDQVKAAMLEHSLAVAKRSSHEMDYVERTVNKAFGD